MRGERRERVREGRETRGLRLVLWREGRDRGKGMVERTIIMRRKGRETKRKEQL